MIPQDGSVFSVIGNTFRLWASFCQERELNNSVFVKHLSDRGFAQFAVPVPAHFVEEFAATLEQQSNIRISGIDGDVHPAALWLGEWTHFNARFYNEPAPISPPPSETQSERFLRRILNGDIRPKRRAQR